MYLTYAIVKLLNLLAVDLSSHTVLENYSRIILNTKKTIANIEIASYGAWSHMLCISMTALISVKASKIMCIS